MSLPLKRVLFVCIGNSCRSQMAEAFARTYGSDVLVPASAGLAPAMGIAPDTMRVMAEKGLDLRDHFPKALRHLDRAEFDLVINMSGFELPNGVRGTIRDWDVPDPVHMRYDDHCDVRDLLERLVMKLIIELRSGEKTTRMRQPGADRLPQ